MRLGTGGKPPVTPPNSQQPNQFDDADGSLRLPSPGRCVCSSIVRQHCLCASMTFGPHWSTLHHRHSICVPSMLVSEQALFRRYFDAFNVVDSLRSRQLRSQHCICDCSTSVEQAPAVLCNALQTPQHCTPHSRCNQPMLRGWALSRRLQNPSKTHHLGENSPLQKVRHLLPPIRSPTRGPTLRSS